MVIAEAEVGVCRRWFAGRKNSEFGIERLRSSQFGRTTGRFCFPVVAGPKGPAYVFEKGRADLPRPSNPESVFMQERHTCRPR